MRITSFLIVLIVTLMLPRPALAWNKAGHMVSGAIAYNELKQTSPQALTRTVNILKQHPEFATRWASQLNQPSIAPENKDLLLFMLAARWSDDARGTAQDRPNWHYINLPYQPSRTSSAVPREVPGEENILGAFAKNLAIVQSSAPDSEKAVAICWMFHLLGDVHQPVHTTKLITTDYPEPEGDRGGTRFYIRAREGSGTISLHKFWDDLVLGSDRFQTVRNKAIELRQRPSHQRRVLPELAETQFNNWAKVESFTLAKQQAYLNGKLVGSSDRSNGKVLPPSYAATVQPVAERRIVLSGYRIADLLDKLF